ncbi:C40 family peptidase [Schaalia suimastitidis]|uniref:C40 family peptidase n=1 Tax=Schaalia suimastitidis TaxID=121163 RepID=UPI00041485AD|nr:C40 family peptidase [Schaalia suimastitidis]
MSNAKYQPRHRKVRRPVAPIAALTETFTSMSPVRSTAVASVTGLALTAVVGGAAQADPVNAEEQALAPVTVSTVNLPATVSVPDIVWEPSIEVTAEAEAPVAEEPVVEVQAVEAASRDEVRADVATTTTNYVAPAVNGAGSDIVSIAMQYIGTPYVYGGTTPAGFDCSGFTQYVYALAGISIPRTSGAQGAAGTKISYAEAQPGDLVWHAYGHVGIYAGNGMVIEARRPGVPLSYGPLWGYDAFIRY